MTERDGELTGEERSVAGTGGSRRRTVLLGAGAVGASAVLAACGTDKADDNGTGDGGDPAGSGTTPAAGPTGGAGSPAGDGGAKLAAASDIPVGGGTIFASRGVVVTQPTAGTFKGFSSVCTHQGCPLSAVDGGTINCTCHGSKFAIEDGSVKAGPAKKPLEAKTVTKSGDDILLG